MMKYLIPFVWFACMACDSDRSKKLPYLGNKVYRGEDTLYHTIADFEFVDQDSSRVTNETFENQIYIADFFFTSCPTICPVMKQQMLRIYEKIEHNDRVSILSHTIDPTHDDVARLHDYAEKLGVTSNKWKFVTGDRDEIYEIGETGYMVPTDESPEAPGGYIHSGAFLLIDKERRVRGMYDGTEEDQVNVLMKDIDVLLREYETK